MKQRVIIFLLLLSSTLSVLAQNATNVRVQQEGENIVITYDLNKQANVRIYVATGQSNRYTELKAVTGSVGKDISAGINKRIIWQPLREQTEFVAQNVRFKVESEPVQYYFSVSAIKKIAFSPGNLQYRASTNTWRFASHQWEYIGNANSNISKNYNGWIDLFGWSGSTGTAKWGISTSKNSDDYAGDFVDWGINIGDGTTYRTLTKDEWFYLIYTRTNAGEKKGVARIKLSDTEYVNGLIFLPDNWTCPEGITFKSGFASSYGIQAYADYQIFTLAKWQQLESAGAVFLPASGSRNGSSMSTVQNHGYYWSASATAYDPNDAYYLYFRSIEAYADVSCHRNYGQVVRLVRDLL